MDGRDEDQIRALVLSILAIVEEWTKWVCVGDDDRLTGELLEELSCGLLSQIVIGMVTGGNVESEGQQRE